MILQYCARLSYSKMPNPRGPLSRAMPSPAITTANKEIRQLTAKSSKRGHYHRYTANTIGIGTAAAGVVMTAALFDIKLLIFIIFKRHTVPLLLRRDHYRSCYTRICL